MTPTFMSHTLELVRDSVRVYYHHTMDTSMKLLFGAILVGAISCNSVLGQETSGQVKGSPILLSRRAEAPEVSHPKGSLFRMPAIVVVNKRPPSITYPQSTEPMLVTEPNFIIRDGAIYLSVFDNVLLPLPGGGASGCFSRDLSERIERLRSVIEAFPSPIPTRLR
jgi:hypothetical protein